MSERAVDLHDQVPRKLRYQLLHPDTEFFPPCEHDPMWRVRLDGGGTEVKAMQLVDLMERLEWLDQVDRASLASSSAASDASCSTTARRDASAALPLEEVTAGLLRPGGR